MTDVQLLIVPYDSGVRGLRMGAGPGKLLERGLVDRLREEGHRVEQSTVDVPSGPFQAEVATAFALNRTLADRVGAAVEAGRFPLVLTGNCMSAVGALAGLEAAAGVFWFDSHGDLNTPETSESGFLDGMALAVVTGRCWRALARTIPGFAPIPDEHVVLAGARALDPPEEELLRRSAIRQVAPAALEAGLSAHAEDLASTVRRGYLHLDLDVLDPGEGRANALAAPEGVSVKALETALEEVVRRVRIGAATLSAYEPEADVDDRAGAAAVHLLVRLMEVVASR